MRPYVLPLALLFIAFTIPSDAQKSGTAEAQAQAQAAEAEVVVQEGAPLTVECALRPEERAEWRLDGELPPADMRAGADRAAGGAGGGLRARLHAAAARAHHAGLYTCRRDPRAAPVRVRVLPAPASPHTRPASEATAAAGAEAATGAGAAADAGATGAAGAGRAAEPYEDYPKALVKYELGSELVFNCTPAEPVSATYQWLKNGTAVESVRELAGRHALEAGGAALRLPHAYENDFGNYTCLVGGEWARGWQAAARLVAKLPSDTNVVEGQKLSITCRLLGKPYARVSWALVGADGNVTALPTAGEGARFAARDSPAGVPGGVLELAAAARADAGNYSCVPPGGHASFTVVRVKDVYAALWPFLGICLEVFVLCAIILVYEKRRTKPELDDSDADTHDQ